MSARLFAYSVRNWTKKVVDGIANGRFSQTLVLVLPVSFVLSQTSYLVLRRFFLRHSYYEPSKSLAAHRILMKICLRKGPPVQYSINDESFLGLLLVICEMGSRQSLFSVSKSCSVPDERNPHSEKEPAYSTLLPQLELVLVAPWNMAP